MIKITPEEATELPVDELAMIVLADLLASHETNEYNYGNRHRQDLDGGYSGNAEARMAISEATGWLRMHGMIARRIEDSNPDSIFVTRRGHEALAKSLAEIRAVDRVQENLHPLLQQRVRRQFLLGEYEQAIFVAMKAVEIRVRELGGFGDDVIGVDLMTQAFKPSGPLADSSAPKGEIEGTMMLFRGAYAILRNPSGHREVSFDDVTEASEAVMTASLLMRMLDKIEHRVRFTRLLSFDPEGHTDARP
jgi:uncharacterized protein (TIGR02391 family)